ncbi:hypothetical protein SEA_TOMAS_211 [Streptomyces phage Tomas]|uniref:Uncharacterized protein n=1 Tax=Streptomyces phage Tomas TaxID=2914443 RepID=A0AA49BRY5_9CAUD|nr:hypothetical protein PP453_gp109 [Streptomyces phage Tomas]UMO76358.1 hypothetical protein SEA_TOMAS_211 [Streptomyces phage Tomas]
MNEDLRKIVDAGKFVGSIALDTIELSLLTRKADEDQRESATSYIKAYEEQNGKVKTKEQWQQFYTGVKKRLTV